MPNIDFVSAKERLELFKPKKYPLKHLLLKKFKKICSYGIIYGDKS